MSNDDFRSFSDFWPYYMREHSKPSTRLVHAAGTLASTALIIALLISRNFRYLPLALIVGYGPAWFAHFFLEKNRPATFKHPLWSLMGDYKMIALMFTGRIR